jgi:two-component system phosphate regulon sensor histidine kinase PhoR
MIKFRRRLLFALIVLVIITLLSIGLLLGMLFKNYYLQSFDERIIKELHTVSLEMDNNGNRIEENELTKIGQFLGVRITIIGKQGDIEFDSTQSKFFENKVKNLIISSSYKGVKIQPSSEYDLHYFYEPIQFNGNKNGFMVLSANTSEIKNEYEQIWWILSISLGFVSILLILLWIRITTRYTKPIESATSVAIELSKGNYRARASVDHMDEMGRLNSTINILARNLQEMVKVKEMQQDRLSVLIENIGAGLILIDSLGYINLINKGYKEIFDVNPDHYLNKLYYEVIDQKEICRIIEEIFITEQAVSKHIILPLRIERRYFDVYGVPIIGKNKVWKGVLLVFHDITDIKKLEQMRKDFVANVSHELKTPVTSIKGFSETLLDGAMNDKQALEEFLSIILKESDRLQSLILDLLELSKIEQQGFRLNVHEFDIVAVLKEIITMLLNKAEEKNIVLEFQSKKEQVFLEGDIYRLKQVFINLIGNAIAYTTEKGEIIVIVNDGDEDVQVIVKDTGVGIEKDKIPRIFERFYRVDRDRSRNSGGTGLGLAIVKHIVEAHNGKINVISELGKGSEFIIKLKKEFKLNR